MGSSGMSSSVGSVARTGPSLDQRETWAQEPPSVSSVSSVEAVPSQSPLAPQSGYTPGFVIDPRPSTSTSTSAAAAAAASAGPPSPAPEPEPEPESSPAAASLSAPTPAPVASTDPGAASGPSPGPLCVETGLVAGMRILSITTTGLQHPEDDWNTGSGPVSPCEAPHDTFGGTLSGAPSSNVSPRGFGRAVSPTASLSRMQQLEAFINETTSRRWQRLTPLAAHGSATEEGAVSRRGPGDSGRPDGRPEGRSGGLPGGGVRVAGGFPEEPQDGYGEHDPRPAAGHGDRNDGHPGGARGGGRESRGRRGRHNDVHDDSDEEDPGRPSGHREGRHRDGSGGHGEAPPSAKKSFLSNSISTTRRRDLPLSQRERAALADHESRCRSRKKPVGGSAPSGCGPFTPLKSTPPLSPSPGLDGGVPKGTGAGASLGPSGRVSYPLPDVNTARLQQLLSPLRTFDGLESFAGISVPLFHERARGASEAVGPTQRRPASSGSDPFGTLSVREEALAMVLEAMAQSMALDKMKGAQAQAASKGTGPALAIPSSAATTASAASHLHLHHHDHYYHSPPPALAPGQGVSTNGVSGLRDRGRSPATARPGPSLAGSATAGGRRSAQSTLRTPSPGLRRR